MGFLKPFNNLEYDVFCDQYNPARNTLVPMGAYVGPKRHSLDINKIFKFTKNIFPSSFKCIIWETKKIVFPKFNKNV